MVFVDQNGQNVARSYVPNPKQPKNAAQQAVTGRFSRVAAFWNALTPTQQLAWASAAAKEGRIGWNVFSSLSNVWLSCHADQGTPPVAPPTGEYAGETATVDAVASDGKVIFEFSAALTNPNSIVQLELQPLKSLSRKPSKGGYRVVGFGVPNAMTLAIPVSVAPGAYAARIAFVDKATGQRTGFTTMPVLGVVLAVEDGGMVEAAKPARIKKAA